MVGNSVRTDGHPSRKAAAASTSAGQSSTRARPRTDETRTAREETSDGYQEKCESWPDGKLYTSAYICIENEMSIDSCPPASLADLLGRLIYLILSERVQSYGEGSRSNKELRSTILPDANSTTSCWSEITDFAQQSTNGGRDARRY
jgi:hypothetical protein